MKNTPKPPIEIKEVFPFLSGKEKTTVRLHPRLDETLKLNQSKLGGQLLWPADEPWPICDKHEEVYVGILQLRAEDFPEIEFPSDTDLLQFLWCPVNNSFDFPEFCVFWRNESEITNSLSKIPQPSQPNKDLVPNACCLFPERVTEYPDIQELDGAEKKEVISWDDENDYIYQSLLSNAPGCKIGGYPNWIQDSEVPICKCGNSMEHLLTIASTEFDPNSASRWCPIEEQDLWQESMRTVNLIRENPLLYQDMEVRMRIMETGKIAAQAQVPSGLYVDIYVFICRQCQEWPLKYVFQCD